MGSSQIFITKSIGIDGRWCGKLQIVSFFVLYNTEKGGLGGGRGVGGSRQEEERGIRRGGET